jgi:hypothetical protein
LSFKRDLPIGGFGMGDGRRSRRDRNDNRRLSVLPEIQPTQAEQHEYDEEPFKMACAFHSVSTVGPAEWASVTVQSPV